MDTLLAYWKPLAIFAGFIVIATIFRPGRKADTRPSDMVFFLILMMLALGGILFYFREHL